MTNAVAILNTKARDTDQDRDTEESIDGERGRRDRKTERKTDRWRARKRGEL